MTVSHSQYGAQIVTRVPVTIMDGFTTAFAKALREGVPVERLDGLVSWVSETKLVIVNNTANERSVLQADLADARRGLANSLRQVERADTPEDGDMWADKASEQRSRVDELQRRLEALDTKPVNAALPEEFESEVGFLLSAVDAMEKHPGSMPRKLVHQQEQIMPDRRVNILPDGRLQVEVRVRVPMAGGVASLGPISWIPNDQPALTVPLMWAAQEAAGQPAPWLDLPQPERAPQRERPTVSPSARRLYAGERTRMRGERLILLDELLEVGCTNDDAMCLLGCGFPQAVHVVLAQARSETPPDWVGDAWADPAWMRWLHAAYVGSPLSWGRSGVWATASWYRQMLIDHTIDAGGRISCEELIDKAVGQVRPGGLKRVLKDEHTDASRSRPHLAPLNKWGEWPQRGQSRVPGTRYGVELFMCERCGDPASVATRAIEVLGDILCPNGHMVRAGQVVDRARQHFPDPAQVIAPPEYQWLRVPPRLWTGRRPVNAGD